MPLQLSEARNEHEKVALHLALFVGAFLAYSRVEGPSIAMQPLVSLPRVSVTGIRHRGVAKSQARQC